MTKAKGSYRERSHARIFSHWRNYACWYALTVHARVLLLEMKMAFIPGTNGELEWSLTDVQKVLACGRTKASRCLVELEKAGFVRVTKVGKFAGNRSPSRYWLTTVLKDGGTDYSEPFQFTQPPFLSGPRKELTGSNQNRTKSRTEPHPVPDGTAAPEIAAIETRPRNPKKPLRRNGNAPLI